MPQPTTSETIQFGQIVLVEDLASALPLEHTAVNVQVTGPVASVAVTQRFANPLQEPAELEYLFPLPAGAAVTGFEIQIGQRRVTGELQEAETARQTYQNALDAGQRGGLLEQRRPNLLAVRLANVLPGEQIQAALRYQERLNFVDDSYEFVFPMGITPKYTSPELPEEGRGVQAPLAASGERIGPVEIQAALDAGVALVGEPSSPSHPIEVTPIDERRFQVRLTGKHLPDHDFVLRYPISGAQAAAAAWVSAETDGQVFLANLAPPRLDDDMEPPAREFIFVLDRSGSMGGEPIAQARNALRACLRALGPRDTFRILLFDHQLEWYRPEAASVTQEEVDQADAYLSALSGRGGTEIVRAIEAALSQPPDLSRVRYVVFLTDGAVSSEGRALDHVRKLIRDARLFTFGIGPSVNRALLGKMASLGRGRAEFLQLDEDIEGAIIRFQDSVSFPMVTDLVLSWDNAKAWDLYPAHLPDLYAGQTLALSGRFKNVRSGVARLKLTGKSAGQPVELMVDLPVAGNSDPAVARLWAQARLEDLLEQMDSTPEKASQLRAEIIGLALTHNLVSPFTSFVAVDQEQANTGGPARFIQVSQPLPKGLLPEPFQVGRPRMMAAPPSPVLPASAPTAMGGMVRNLLTRVNDAIPQAKHTSAARSISDASTDAFTAPISGEGAVQAPEDRESGLRWLARTQRMDGSWDGNVEQTAAALLAFLRAGHTPRSGSFRQQMRRGVQWLHAAQASGLGAFLRALALVELARLSGDGKDQAAAQAARDALPTASGLVEQAASGAAIQAPQAIQTLDDLRLAGVLGSKIARNTAPADLFAGSQADLARTWLVAIL